MRGRSIDETGKFVRQVTMANLIKLKIEAFSDAKCTASTGKSITAVINPESYSLSYGVKYEASKEKLNNANTQIFTGMNASSLDLNLIVDGTGVVPLPGFSDVDSYITELKSIVYNYQGSYHRPNYLKITWGDKLKYTCVCESLSMKYTLFKPDGTALRANVTLKFKENIDFKTKLKMAQMSSPDLTHVRTVKAGDTLPLMTYRIYGDSSWYPEVARFNNLRHFSAIKPGDEIHFPPLKK
jgi:hypothetical protein